MPLCASSQRLMASRTASAAPESAVGTRAPRPVLLYCSSAHQTHQTISTAARVKGSGLGLLMCELKCGSAGSSVFICTRTSPSQTHTHGQRAECTASVRSLKHVGHAIAVMIYTVLCKCLRSPHIMHLQSELLLSLNNNKCWRK